MQRGSPCKTSELNSLLEDPADGRFWQGSLSEQHHYLAVVGEMSMSYLPAAGIASLSVTSRVSHDPGDMEDGL